MKRLTSIIIMATLAISSYAQFKMNITINGKTLSATMVDNSSTRALKEQLEQGNITYEAHDYGGFEKVGDIGQILPQNNEYINTVPGDIILYQGSNICLYYDSNSWNFTRMGQIDFTSTSELRTFLNAGGGNIHVTLSIASDTGVSSVIPDVVSTDQQHDIQGRRLSSREHHQDIYISKGKKYIKK